MLSTAKRSVVRQGLQPRTGEQWRVGGDQPQVDTEALAARNIPPRSAWEKLNPRCCGGNSEGEVRALNLEIATHAHSGCTMIQTMLLIRTGNRPRPRRLSNHRLGVHSQSHVLIIFLPCHFQAIAHPPPCSPTQPFYHERRRNLLRSNSSSG